MKIYLLWYDGNEPGLEQVFGGAFSGLDAAKAKAVHEPGAKWEFDGVNYYIGSKCWIEPSELGDEE